MIVGSLILSALFWYGGSKYFGAQYPQLALRLEKQSWVLKIIGTALAFVAAAFCVQEWGWLTGVWLWGLSWLGIVTLPIILIPLHARFLHVLLGLSALSFTLNLLV